MPTVTLNPGEKLVVQFAETDGEFEIHFDSPEKPQSITILESVGLTGNTVGPVLYQEKFWAIYPDPENTPQRKPV